MKTQDTTNSETLEEMQRDFRRLQHHLRAAHAMRTRIVVEYGLDEDEMVSTLREMIGTADVERSMFESMLSDDYEELDTDEGGKDAWRGKDA